MLKVTILDGYVDEPTCLGVPPYISPYPRYIAGAVWDFNPHARIQYLTVDQLRRDRSLLERCATSDVLAVIAGMTVPGRYLSGLPMNPRECIAFLSNMEHPVRLLCGPAARYGFGTAGGKEVTATAAVKEVFDVIVTGDGEVVVSELVHNKLRTESIDPSRCRSDASFITKYALRGAPVVKQHPFFPTYLITEIETYRGCSRSVTGGCSFCSEPNKGPPSFRTQDDICKEIEALYNKGIRHVRVGNQPCIFSYMAKGAGEAEFPQPNPEAVERLFKGIRTHAHDLKTLHIDNANPGVIARFPDESRRIAKTIIKYHSSGDVAALGVESVDPIVINQNNLKASPEEALAAVKLLNDVGSARGTTGLPELLPGLNFVFGLKGETRQTFELDFEFLNTIMGQGLLVRRINLRQVIPLPGTPMAKIGEFNVHKHKALFQQFKRRVRETIERPMLARLVPQGTILTDLYTELYEGKLTFARQLGSYPLLVGIPGVFPLHRFYDVKVVDYGYRSITAVPYPLDINMAPRETLEAVPGIGKKRAIRILRKRPYHHMKEIAEALDDVTAASAIAEYLGLD
ncbi:MAG TPA: radical SAM protein [Candidatus Thermoplasmatota archaeon]|nr:radical SAM protein [Candidatus Thermoplasmatota archaeon]